MSYRHSLHIRGSTNKPIQKYNRVVNLRKAKERIDCDEAIIGLMIKFMLYIFSGSDGTLDKDVFI